jgi:hypothetical protein
VVVAVIGATVRGGEDDTLNPPSRRIRRTFRPSGMHNGFSHKPHPRPKEGHRMTAATTTDIAPLEALARTQELIDLTAIRRKLADPEEGKGLMAEQLDVMEAEYRRFLAMHLAYPGADVVPCKIVDEIWHQHILDTRAYARDCDALFGEFLHHFPYFGMNGPDDAQALHDAYAWTIERYRDAFGEPPAGTWISADAAKCKRTACKPMKCR